MQSFLVAMKDKEGVGTDVMVAAGVASLEFSVVVSFGGVVVSLGGAVISFGGVVASSGGEMATTAVVVVVVVVVVTLAG